MKIPSLVLFVALSLLAGSARAQSCADAAAGAARARLPDTLWLKLETERRDLPAEVQSRLKETLNSHFTGIRELQGRFRMLDADVVKKVAARACRSTQPT